MTPREKPRIVLAMEEIAERRDYGERVTDVLDEVARDYAVPIGELERRAIASWGSPLETDRERNSAHFEAVEIRRTMIESARSRARELWFDMIPRGGKPLWFVSVKNWLTKQDLDDVQLEKEMREAFMAEIECLDRKRAAGLIPDVNN